MDSDYNDYELISLIAEDNEDAGNALFKKYEPLINKTARKMYKYMKNSGVELNDVVQEGMIGLSNAIENYRDSKEALFYTYAKTCIERKMIDMIVATRRQKNIPLNSSMAMEFENEEDIDYLFKDEEANPEDILMGEEVVKNILKKAEKALSKNEYEVFDLKINGFDNKEIANILEIDYKQVDNSLQRIKRKLKEVLK